MLPLLLTSVLLAVATLLYFYLARPLDMPLTPQQKSATNSFAELTSTDKRTAEKHLRQHGWNLQRAVDAYYAGGGAPSAPPSPHAAALNKLFDSYRDDPANAPNEIRIDGVQKYLAELDVGLDSPALLVLSTLVRSPSLGTIPRDGFVDAWSHLNAPAPKQQALALANLSANAASIKAAQALHPSHNTASAAADESLFRRVYKHTFTLALPTNTPNARAVPLDEASEYWKLLLGPRSPGLHWEGRAAGTPLLEWWLSFLGTSWKKAVNRDLWNQTLLFAERSVDDERLGFWDEESAWPSVVDLFVEYVRERQGGGKGGEEESMDTS